MESEEGPYQLFVYLDRCHPSLRQVISETYRIKQKNDTKIYLRLSKFAIHYFSTTNNCLLPS